MKYLGIVLLCGCSAVAQFDLAPQPDAETDVGSDNGPDAQVDAPVDADASTANDAPDTSHDAPENTDVAVDAPTVDVASDANQDAPADAGTDSPDSPATVPDAEPDVRVDAGSDVPDVSIDTQSDVTLDVPDVWDVGQDAGADLVDVADASADMPREAASDGGNDSTADVDLLEICHRYTTIPSCTAVRYDGGTGCGWCVGIDRCVFGNSVTPREGDGCGDRWIW